MDVGLYTRSSKCFHEETICPIPTKPSCPQASGERHNPQYSWLSSAKWYQKPLSIEFICETGSICPIPSDPRGFGSGHTLCSFHFSVYLHQSRTDLTFGSSAKVRSVSTFLSSKGTKAHSDYGLFFFVNLRSVTAVFGRWSEKWCVVLIRTRMLSCGAVYLPSGFLWTMKLAPTF